MNPTTIICPICSRQTCACMLNDRLFLARQVGRLMRGKGGSLTTSTGGCESKVMAVRPPERAADWDQTPEEVCRKIIGLITWAEGEFVLEPFRGDGNFYRNLPAWVRKDWCEKKENRDFFEYTGPSPDTIITNPPYRDEADGNNLAVPCLERCLQLARKRVIFFVNHKVFNALSATRLKKYGEWNWGITHLSVWDMKKWPGRYYVIIWEKDKPSIIDYFLASATESDEAANGK